MVPMHAAAIDQLALLPHPTFFRAFRPLNGLLSVLVVQILRIAPDASPDRVRMRHHVMRQQAHSHALMVNAPPGLPAPLGAFQVEAAYGQVKTPLRRGRLAHASLAALGADPVGMEGW